MGTEKEKPEVQLLGSDGNIFAVTARARRALIETGMDEEARKMSERVMESHSYDEALGVIMEYVDPY